jgi:L-lactate dehydrogenase complex protein LldG
VSAAREDVLARVRAALTRPDGTRPAPPEVRRPAAPAAAPDPTEVVERFAERAAEYRATVRRAPAGEVAAVVGEALAAHGARRVGVAPGLEPAWRPAGVDLVEDAALPARELDRLEGVVTGCALAIAETGTIVLDGGPRSGRRALTLVPDLHVCVVDAEQVVASVPEAIAALGAAVREAGRPLTFVSGPSATSDIELDRVEGVHGPRRLEVVVAG